MVSNCPLVESEVAGIMEIDWNQPFLLLKKQEKKKTTTDFRTSTLLSSSIFVRIDLSVLR